MTRGLTLGKFAPLHIGHKFLIDFALQHVDELVIVIYACDELPVCPLETRIDWINQLYPTVKVIAAKDGPKEVGYSQAITNKHDAYLKHLLQDYTFDCFFSSEPYGEHVSLALNCRDIRVDQSRTKIPISATQIRQNIAMNKQFLPPVVLQALTELT